MSINVVYKKWKEFIFVDRYKIKKKKLYNLKVVEEIRSRDCKD